MPSVEDIKARLFGSTKKVLEVDCGKYGTFYIKVMSSADRESWSRECWGDDGETKASVESVRARLVIRCLSDADGNRIFSDADYKQFQESTDFRLIAALYNECVKFNAVGDTALEEAKKNSEKTSS